MSLRSYLNPSVTGTTVTFAAADVAGDRIAPSDTGVLLVKNDSASAITATVVVPGNTRYGQPDPDVAVSVAAGAVVAIGPFPRGLIDSTDRTVHVTYSSVTSVSVAALQL